MRSKNKTGSPAPWSAEKALPYLASLCAKCEQCEEDLRLKMRRHCMEEGDMDSIIAYLYEHKFLDEERSGQDALQRLGQAENIADATRQAYAGGCNRGRATLP